jgi:hypothetical protein
MSVVLDKVTEIQDQVIDYIGSVKEPVNFVMDRVPEIPAVPFADKLATPAEVVDAEFAFAGRLLDANKEIAVGVVKAATPLTNKLLDRKAVKSAAKKPATKSTPKAATKAA